MPKKKRTKAYRPKPVRAPDLLVKLAPELTESQRTEIELQYLLPLRALLSGEGTAQNAWDVMQSLQIGFVMAQALETEQKLQTRILLSAGYAGALLAYIETRKGNPRGVQAWWLEATQHALEVVADISRQLTRTELYRAYEEENRRALALLGPDVINVIDPKRPETWRGKAFEMVGFMYIHGRAFSGLLREIDGSPFWWNPEIRALVRIDGPKLLIQAGVLRPGQREELIRDYGEGNEDGREEDQFA